jgi:hypothetical protein
MKLTRGLFQVLLVVGVAVLVSQLAVPAFIHLAGPVLARLVCVVAAVVLFSMSRSVARS